MIKISKKAAIRSPWFIGWMVLLIVVIAMNVVMIMFAMEDSPGVVTDDFYERGQTYDKELNERNKTNPGWKVEYIQQVAIIQNQTTSIQFKLSNKDGSAVLADKVMLYLYRPANKNDDFFVALTTTDGINYTGDVRFKLKGAWDAVIEVTKQKEIRNFAQRLTVYEK